MKVSFLCVLFFSTIALAEKQCSKGPCCNIAKGTFKSKGSKCSKSSNECLVAAGTCSGFSANCARMNAVFFFSLFLFSFRKMALNVLKVSVSMVLVFPSLKLLNYLR